MGNVLFTVSQDEVDFTGKTVMELMAEKRQNFWESVTYKGSEEVTECSYPDFMRKNAQYLTSSEKFSLFDTAKDTFLSPPVPLSDAAQLRKIIDGKRFTNFIKGDHGSTSIISGNPRVTSTQVAFIQEKIEYVKQKPDQPKTAWTELVESTPPGQRQDPVKVNEYLQKKADTIDKTGAGLFIVDPRDVCQAGAGSMSWLLAENSALGFKKLLPGGQDSCIYGVEWGGAQPAGALRHGVDPTSVRDVYQTDQHRVIWLNRSEWGQGLSIKSPKAQAYINEFHGKTAYTANQFHAGNVKSTTAIEDSMREHHLVIPNNVWDPTQPDSHFESWIDEKLDAHIAFCNANGIKTEDIVFEFRIKNPGEKPEWNREVLHKLGAIADKKCKEKGLREKCIMLVHNHNMTGRTSDIAKRFIEENRAKGMPVRPIFDVGHQGNNTHNDILTVASAMTLTSETRKALVEWSDYQGELFGLLKQWDSRDLARKQTSPDSLRAGGTTSSDMEDFISNGLDTKLIDKAYSLGATLTGLRGIVTPYSEINKQIGKAAFLNTEFNEFLSEIGKTQNNADVEDLRRFINSGGTLTLPSNVLTLLHKWTVEPEGVMRETPAPDVIVKLLRNLNYTAESESVTEDTFDPEKIKAELQEKYPNTLITDEDIYNVAQFGSSLAEKLISERNELGYEPGKLFLENPFIYVRGIEEGDLIKYGDSCAKAVNKQNIGIDEFIITIDHQGTEKTLFIKEKASAIEADTIKLASDIPDGVGAHVAGELKELLVKPGQEVKEGDTLAVLEALKQENRLVASHAGVIGQLFANPGDSLKRNQALLQLQKRSLHTMPITRVPTQVLPEVAAQNIMGARNARIAQTGIRLLQRLFK